MDELLMFGYCRNITQNILINDIANLCLKYFRPNVFWEVRNKTKQYKQEIVTLIKESFPNQCGIVYCLTRLECTNMKDILEQNCISAVMYHSGLSKQIRDDNQLQWSTNKAQVMIATCAFGHQINKNNIRFIIHSTIPSSVDAYYEQCIKAGLDGDVSLCILYFNASDRFRIQFFIRVNVGTNIEKAKEDQQKLWGMIAYCQNTVECRRVILSHYTDDRAIKEQCQMNRNALDWCKHRCNKLDICHGCDNCNEHALHFDEKMDVTSFAMDICNIVKQLGNHKNVTLTQLAIIRIFRGSKSDIKLSAAFSFEEFGKGKHLKRHSVKRLITALLCQNILTENNEVNRNIKLGSKYCDFQMSDKRIYLTLCKLKI
eukprot:350032_1